MCRRNQLWGCMMIAFGMGLLFGLWIESGFLPYCLSLGLIILGFGTIRKY